jgi:hypothetical protein
VLEGWLLLSIADHSPIPDIDGNRIEISKWREMPVIGPIQRRELIVSRRGLGFEAPVSGGDHQYTRGRERRLRLPHPHTQDFRRSLAGSDSAPGQDRPEEGEKHSTPTVEAFSAD